MQQIANYGHDTAENILWHPEENALYWLDIPAGQLFRGYFPNLKRQELSEFRSECILQMDEAIGGFVFCEAACNVGFLLFASQGRIYEWQYSGKSEKPKLYAQLNLVPSRFNDVFAWPKHHSVLCGTMPTEGKSDSRLLLFDAKTRKAEVLLEGLKLANGMGMSPDRSYLYFADTRNFAVHRFDVQNQTILDTEAGMPPHKWIDFQGRQGRPDGLCVDAQGRIWLAETGAGCITCFSPEGQERTKLAVGTPKVTSCCFGGSAQDILFVSTQNSGEPAEEQKAGGIFAKKMQNIYLGNEVSGQAEFLL